MKKYLCKNLFLLLSIGLGSGLASCSEDTKEAVEELPFMNVSPIHLNAKGEVPYTGTFTINTNQTWNIEEKPSWVTLDAMKGNGEQVVTASISTSEKNFRSGNIVISTLDRNFTETIEVAQNGNTLSVVTGEHLSSKVTSGAFMGPNKNQYKYKHELTLEFSVNGSHLASEYGVTSSAITGFLTDGKHQTVVTLLSNRPATTFTYRAYAIDKATGNKVYGLEKTTVSSAN